MNKPAYYTWANESDSQLNNIPSFPFQISFEKEANFAEVYKAANWKKKILLRFVQLFGYSPQLSFQKEDVDMKIVEKMLKHKDLLTAVDKWIWETDYKLLEQLQVAKKVFGTIQKPPTHQYLYRGFSIDSGQQNTGIDEKYKKIKIGDKWSYTPDNPMSFSWHKGTTSAYGNIIVSADYTAISKRCLHITHEMIYALFAMDGNWNPTDDFYISTYAESVLLPDGKPIEITLVSKG